ncbi:xdhc- coxi [Lucifera butyrica]|uniref:Xdhc- coxi n=1 Tax=Lucifera butyrica TaxID=1351585 RepID=A0A498RF35_9FIRM|nr:XdhC family protein [Lucifera butyrica]VBB08712.1 xdhc- coxi [Lucifera butyrica]
MESQLLPFLCEVQKNDEKAALVSIISTRGSTPRKAGCQMLVYPDGRIQGTIGGGCGEAEVRQQALTGLDTGRSFLYTVRMVNEAAAQDGMVCGGIMEVFIQIIQ